MIPEPNCSIRRCRHFTGVKSVAVDTDADVPVCPAFPNGIPTEIAYGNDKHSVPHQGQAVPHMIYEKV